MRRERLLVILLIPVLCVCFLSACTEQPEPEPEPTVYGTVSFNTKMPLPTIHNYTYNETVLDEIEAFREEHLVPTDYSIYFLYLGNKNAEKISLQDVSDCRGYTIHYADGENLAALPNAVVATKWVYYYSLLCDIDAPELTDDALEFYQRYHYRDDVKNRLSVPFFDDWDKFNILFHDEYCMEKVCFEPSEYECKDPSSPYFGWTARYAYNMYKSGAVDEDHKAAVAIWNFADRNNDPIFSTGECWTSPLIIAAMERYSLIDVESLEKKVGKIALPTGKELNVIGYIETEADKLLSTGVSLDESSPEYQTVLQQLQNPVLYSACGDFMPEITYVFPGYFGG